MKSHIVENGIVVNTILASVDEARLAFPNAEIIDGEVGAIGWFWDGEVLTPPPSPSSVPQIVTPRQARLVLALTPSGDENFPTMLAKVEAAFNSLPEPDKTVAQITWEYSTSVERTNPLISQMQSVIGFTDEQIDQLFIQAATL